jgi:hypothetical protein
VRTTIISMIAAVVLAVGCSDNFGPIRYNPVQDTVVLYSLSRAELIKLPAAFDVPGMQAMTVESGHASGQWDVALAEDETGFILLPLDAFPGMNTRAGIAVMEGYSMADVTHAPADTAAYTRRTSVPVLPGPVYVVRARRVGGCTFYGKLQAERVLADEGSVKFGWVVSPNCNDRSFELE